MQALNRERAGLTLYSPVFFITLFSCHCQTLPDAHSARPPNVGSSWVPGDLHLCPKVQPWVAGQQEVPAPVIEGHVNLKGERPYHKARVPGPPLTEIARTQGASIPCPWGRSAALAHTHTHLSSWHQTQEASLSPPP